MLNYFKLIFPHFGGYIICKFSEFFFCNHGGFLSLLDSNKRIKAGVCVKGKFGPLVPNMHAKHGKNTCRLCSEGTGIVLCAVNAKRWPIKRDQNSKAVEACICILKIIDATTGVTVDEL